ncbi:hypothetical protein SEUCBS140593_006902 [Sporothrix eucalyptigena]|uniref:CN hydrolase domain-containing protein n=1 Tax=Sporothrix eucalyptigena TaxID=1812306 RepID=A0ABP0C9V4_9PEZI
MYDGYNFRSLAEISPYLEPSGSGISALWARTTALKLNCNVVVGYPEKVDVTQKWPASPEFYNSAIIISRDGETIANYRKSFLYAIDETWALEGRDGFFEGYVPGLGNIAMGICMDLKFEAPWTDFEFAFHILEVEANLVIITMAWLTREGAHTFSQQPQEPDLQTLEYWVQRLEPVVRKDTDEEIIVVFCNRAGTEGDAVYAGTSSVIGIKNGDINLYGVLGRGVKELLVVDTRKAPFAKLLQASNSQKADVSKSDGQSSVQSTTESSPSQSVKSTPFSAKQPFVPFRDTSRLKDYDNDVIATPIDDIDDAWEIKSNMASLGSSPTGYSQTERVPASNSLPKLELKIPTATKEALHLFQHKVPTSSTRDRDGKSPALGGDDIPTPTAPSPTPMSVRPHFNLPDKGIMSLRPHIDLPEVKPPLSLKSDVIPTSVNTKSGGGAVKVNRADTPITPPWKTGTQGKVRGPAPISEAPPSPPSDEETGGPGNLKVDLTAVKNAKQPKNDALKSSGTKSAIDRISSGTSSSKSGRPRTSSLKTQVGPARSFPSAATSATFGLDTATPTTTTVTLESIWGDALQKLKAGGNNITEEPVYCRNDIDDILVDRPSSHLDTQEPLLADARHARLPGSDEGRASPAPAPKSTRPSAGDTQKANTTVDASERQPSPAPAILLGRPASTKARNASLPRLPHYIDPSDPYRSMSQSRMSIPIVASPSVFHQDPLSQSHSRRPESPIYFRPETKGSNKPGTGNNTPSNGASGSGVLMKQATRPVSRGRQPTAKENATNGTVLQSTQWSNSRTSRDANNEADLGRQAPNSRPAETVSRTGPPSSLSMRGRSLSTTSASPWPFGTPPLTRTQPPLDPDDDIIAVINLIHNDCPVHTSRAPSLGPQTQIQVQEAPQSESQTEQQAEGGSRERRRHSQQIQGTPRVQTPGQQQRSQTPAAQINGAEPVYEIILPPHIRELVESMSSPGSRIQSPLRALDLLRPDRTSPKFDPPTPTAMLFEVNEKAKPASA